MAERKSRPRRSPNSTSPLAGFMDRVSGKESSLEARFDDVKFGFGEDPVLRLTGGVSLKVHLLR